MESFEAMSEVPLNEPSGESPFAVEHDGSVFPCYGHFDASNFDDFLIWAQQRKVSDITIQTGSEVLAEVSGRVFRMTDCTLSANSVESIVRHVYGENGPAEIHGGVDLDPSYDIRTKDGEYMRFRVNITGGRIAKGLGIQISIRPLPGLPIEISQLDVEPEIVANFRPRQGMVLVTGPTGSGKSTLLASGIRMIVEKPDANEKVLEYSVPIENVYEGITMPSSSVFQTHAGIHLRPRNEAGIGSLFAYCIRNALRRNPTIIVIGESRDKATMEASVEAALTGHLLYTTMHTMGIGSTIRRAVMPFKDSSRQTVATDIMESLRLIVSQILVPKIGGGQVACREFMVFDEATREEFHREHVDNWPTFARQLLLDGRVIGRTLHEAAHALVSSGKISEEVCDRIANRERI